MMRIKVRNYNNKRKKYILGLGTIIALTAVILMPLLLLLPKSSPEELGIKDLEATSVGDSDDGEYLDHTFEFTANENDEYTFIYDFRKEEVKDELEEIDWRDVKPSHVSDVYEKDSIVNYVIPGEDFRFNEKYVFLVSYYNSEEETPVIDDDLKISEKKFSVRSLKTKEIIFATPETSRTTADLSFTVDNPDNIPENTFHETTSERGENIKTDRVNKGDNNQYTINLTELVPNTWYTTTVTVGRAIDELEWSTTNTTLNLGSFHSSLFTSDDKLFMWGNNYRGQLGTGNTNHHIDTPTNITANFVGQANLIGAQISLGRLHSSLLTSDGELFMWGRNVHGQLGTGDRTDRTTPTNITDKFEKEDLIGAQISLGSHHSSLLTSDGELFMWGWNDFGQLGIGDTNDTNTPTNITDKFGEADLIGAQISPQISLGEEHSSLLTSDGKLFMWGRNERGQLGTGDRTDRTTPTNITDNFGEADLIGAQISLGTYHSSLLTSDGKLFMWGWNNNGQLGIGIGDTNDTDTPTNITDKFGEADLIGAQISLGHALSSLLTSDGELFMWGYNKFGQLGTGESGNGTNKNTPANITDKFGGEADLIGAQISLGNYYSSLLTNDDELFMWGKNDFGQLGIGDTNNTDTPIRVII